MFAAQQKVGFSGTFTQQVAMRAWAEISSQQEGVEVLRSWEGQILFFFGDVLEKQYVATKKHENE